MKGMSRNPFVLLTLFAALTEAAVVAAPQANELNPEGENRRGLLDARNASNRCSGVRERAIQRLDNFFSDRRYLGFVEDGETLSMLDWPRKAVAALSVSTWLLSLGASYVLGTVVHDCINSRYAEAAFGAAMVVYILPTLVTSLRRHPNFKLLIQTNLLLGVTIAGWLVCFVWSCYKHAKTKHMLLSLIVIFVLFGAGFDAFRSLARTEESAIAEAVWQAFSVTGIAAWMVFAGCEAIRVVKKEGENKPIRGDGKDADRLH